LHDIGPDNGWLEILGRDAGKERIVERSTKHGIRTRLVLELGRNPPEVIITIVLLLAPYNL